ncbi:hypothetical protein KC19_VG129100 [Ceratodon purpureus]|uniref:Uncharacterized protein n=1 Tax=Ceratodon purpureus TaxID=3225 RepID=A0A8T0HPM7_CERPU|nr:hypothetical protein KC19_VG129100 [Ceratodon purpureus]
MRIPVHRDTKLHVRTICNECSILIVGSSKTVDGSRPATPSDVDVALGAERTFSEGDAPAEAAGHITEH